jgi:hypothetical protein
MAELTVPRVDFSTLGDIPQVYRQAQRDVARQQTLAELGNGSGNLDYMSAAKKLLAAGDVQGAQTLASLGSNERDFNFRQTESQRAQGNADRTFALTQKQAEEKPQYMQIDDGNGGKSLVKIDPYGKGVSTVQPTGAQPPQASNPVPPGVDPHEWRKKQADLASGMPQAQAHLTDAHANLDRLKEAATAIKNDPNLIRTVGVGSMIPTIPGSGVANVEANLEALKSQVGFGVLQAMRDASKTGGALGNVSNAEGARLEANLAALNPKQSHAQFMANLQKVIDYADAAKGRLKTAYDGTYGKFQQGSQSQQQSAQPQPQNAAPQTWTDPATNKTYKIINGVPHE